MVNIPVLQESRLQILNIEVPQVAALGEPSRHGGVCECGKSGFKKFNGCQRAIFPKKMLPCSWKFEIGQSEFTRPILHPAGRCAGRQVIFTYTDNSNQEVVTEWPFSVKVQQIALQRAKETGRTAPIDPPPRSQLYYNYCFHFTAGGAGWGNIMAQSKTWRDLDEEL